jgi:hypothetical protein
MPQVPVGKLSLFTTIPGPHEHLLSIGILLPLWVKEGDAGVVKKVMAFL